MDRSPRRAPAAWLAIVAALAYGIVELVALSRSRAIDSLSAWRHTLNRR